MLSSASITNITNEQVDLNNKPNLHKSNTENEHENDDFFDRESFTGPIFLNIAPVVSKGDNSSIWNMESSSPFLSINQKPSMDASLNKESISTQISNKIDTIFLKKVANNLDILLSFVRVLSSENENNNTNDEKK